MRNLMARLIARALRPWRRDTLAAPQAPHVHPECRELIEAAHDAALDADEQGAHEAAEYWRQAAAYWAGRSVA